MVSSCNVFQIGDQNHPGQLLKISKLIARSWSFGDLKTAPLGCWEMEIGLRFAVFSSRFTQEETEARECPHSHSWVGTWTLTLPVDAWPRVLGSTPQLKSTRNSTLQFSQEFRYSTEPRKALWVSLFMGLFSVAYPTSSLFSPWLVLNFSKGLTKLSGHSGAQALPAIQVPTLYLLNCPWKAEGSSLMPAYVSYWLTDLRQSWFLFHLPSLPCC